MADCDGFVAVREATVRYGRRVALEAVTGECASGSLTAVIGANGAGKSTLLAAIAGVIPLAGGTVQRPPRQRVGYLAQQVTMDRDYPITIAELIVLGGWAEFGAFRAPPAGLRARAAAAAATVGLTDRLQRQIAEASAGELQRALFARLILQDPALILLDEPFAPIDAATTAALVTQVMRWHGEGRTVVAVLHDLELVQALFPDTVVLARRCLAWGPTAMALPALAEAA